MKLRLLNFVCMVCILLTARAQTVYYSNVSLEDLRRLSLPLLDIQTVDGELPTYEEALHPPGAMGKSIRNATKVPARLTIVQKADTLYDSGPYVEEQSGLTIKVRGNTSAYNLWKPYKLKLQKKADLLCRGNDARYKDKHWVLLADASMRTAIGFQLSEWVGMDWTPAWEFVNVRLNGQYIGLYVLCEQVRRNASCRINVDAETGYIIEHDAYWWNEEVYVASTSGRKFTFKYPDAEEVSPQQMDYINAVVNTLDESIADGTYPEQLDVASWARWVLAHDILGTRDSGGANFYLSKYDDTSRSLLRACVLWDFGTAFRTTSQWSRLHTDTYTYFPSLFNNANPAFRKAYLEAWQELSPWLFDDMIRWLDGWLGTEQLQAMQTSRSWMQSVYDFFDISFTSEIKTRRQWFEQRRLWMEEEVEAEINVPTPVISIISKNKNDTPAYDLLGRRISPDSKGLQVRGGRVVVVQ